MDDLAVLVAKAQQAIEQSAELAQIDQIRVDYLGKKGHLTSLMKSLRELPVSQRPEKGRLINEAKQQVQAYLQDKQQRLMQQALRDRVAREKIDVTLPAPGGGLGSWHPISRVRRRIEAFFSQMGFEIVTGPEIETDYYNFSALNIPEHHPAKAMHDTFYFADGSLLRTHTSPVQIRAMETRKPPVRLIAPGRTYRCDSDATHSPMFHQIEGLYIDEHVSFSQLKMILQQMLNAFFEQSVRLRFRASYFPFTEPSAEVDIEFSTKKGRWLEILGCGMVHPHVLQSMQVDPERYSGWAFGLGIERLAMLRYGIDDLRVMFDNDNRFLQQF